MKVNLKVFAAGVLAGGGIVAAIRIIAYISAILWLWGVI